MTGAAVVLLFPGQGSQHRDMCADLIARDEVVRDGFYDALDAMGPLGIDVARTWLGDGDGLHHVSRAQPLLFATGYAAGRAALSRGVEPAALLGHSGGELVAATLGGWLDLDAAAGILVDRVAAATRLAPPGGMIAVAAPVDDVVPHLQGCDVAAVNAPRQAMIAGTADQLRAARTSLAQHRIAFVDVAATEPFHSRAMRPVADVSVAAPRAGSPRSPVYSGYTARRLTRADVESGRFWADQVVQPVLFADALTQLLRDLPAGPAVVAEAGAGQVLTSFVRRNPGIWERTTHLVPLLPAGASGREKEHFDAALATLAHHADGALLSA